MEASKSLGREKPFKSPAYRFRRILEKNKSETEACALIPQLDNVDIRMNDGRTALHIAAVRGYGELARLLIEKGANIEAQDMGTWTPLHLASGHGNLLVVKLLLQHGAEVDYKDRDSWTALHQSLSTPNLEIALELLKAGADTNIVTTDDRKNVFDRMIHIPELDEFKINVASQMEDGAPERRIAQWDLRLTQSRQKWERSITPSVRSVQLLSTPSPTRSATKLHKNSVLTMSGHQFTWKRLLAKANFRRQRDDNYPRPEVRLFIALSDDGDEEEAILAIELMGNVDELQSCDRTPLHIASVKGFNRLAGILVKKGAKTEAVDKDSSTPLHLASENGHLEIVEILLDSGANVNHKDRHCSTSLHLASENGHFKIVKMLVDRGADLDHKDDHARTALYRALSQAHLGIVRTLLDAGADSKITTADEHDRFKRATKNLSPINLQAFKAALTARTYQLEHHEVVRALETPYRYRPLQRHHEQLCNTATSQEIRLILFEEKLSAPDQILVRIENHINNSCSYVGISYVWGEPTFTHKVLCDGGTSHLKVTERVFRMLRMLHQSQYKAVWIDAICINQADTMERNHQVQQMAEIYRNADHVRIFLDTPSLSARDCVQSKYWTRRWVIQEVVSAKQVFVDSNDIEKMESMTLDEVANACDDYSRQCQELDSGPVRSTLSKIQELHGIRFGIMRKYLFSESIFTNLLHFYDTDCVDARDRLYAFFAISSADLTVITPHQVEPNNPSKDRVRCAINYELPVMDVFTGFAIAALRSTHAIELLHCAGAFHSPLDDEDDRTWPSWIPDWRYARLYNPLIRAIKFVPVFPTIGRVNVDIDPESRSITVPGYRVGTVVSGQTLTSVPDIERHVEINYTRHGRIDMSLDRVAIAVHVPRLGTWMPCWAPPTTRLRDVVVTFVSAKTPFILRAAGERTFRLVGDCWLEAAMNSRSGPLPKLDKVERFNII